MGGILVLGPKNDQFLDNKNKLGLSLRKKKSFWAQIGEN